MPTNPNNALGTNGAFGGRTSVNAFNDVLGAFSRGGILSGWDCVASSGMTVTLGGGETTRDVAIAQDPYGNKTTINNISGTAVSVTIPAASLTGNRIDTIVAYVNSPAEVGTTTLDNPSAVGIIVVSGSEALSPVPADESVIRSAITADGGTGTTAYYVELAQVLVPIGTTDILQQYIAQLNYAPLGEKHIGTYDALPTPTGPNVFRLGALTVVFGTNTVSQPSQVNAFTNASGTYQNRYTVNQAFGTTFVALPYLFYTVTGSDWKFTGVASWTQSVFNYFDVLRNDNQRKSCTVSWIAFGY